MIFNTNSVISSIDFRGGEGLNSYNNSSIKIIVFYLLFTVVWGFTSTTHCDHDGEYDPQWW